MASRDIRQRIIIIGEDKTKQALNSVERNVGGVKSAVDRAITAISGFIGLEWTFQGISGLKTMSDTALELDARLKLVTSSGEELNRVSNDLLAISLKTGTELKANTLLYTRIKKPLDDMGYGLSESTALTKSMALGLKISGASTAEAASTILQFSQAMASGVLRGEEYNAVNEAAPRLIRAMTDELGISQGELRKLANDGLLTADIAAKALIDSMGNLEKEASSIPLTISGSIENVRSQLIVFLNEYNHVNKVVGEGIRFFGDNLNTVSEVVIPAVITGAILLTSALLKKAAAWAASGLQALKSAKSNVSLTETLTGLTLATKKYNRELIQTAVIQRNAEITAAVEANRSKRATLEALELQQKSILGSVDEAKKAHNLAQATQLVSVIKERSAQTTRDHAKANHDAAVGQLNLARANGENAKVMSAASAKVLAASNSLKAAESGLAAAKLKSSETNLAAINSEGSLQRARQESVLLSRQVYVAEREVARQRVASSVSVNGSALSMQGMLDRLRAYIVTTNQAALTTGKFTKSQVVLRAAAFSTSVGLNVVKVSMLTMGFAAKGVTRLVQGLWSALLGPIPLIAFGIYELVSVFGDADAALAALEVTAKKVWFTLSNPGGFLTQSAAFKKGIADIEASVSESYEKSVSKRTKLNEQMKASDDSLVSAAEAKSAALKRGLQDQTNAQREVTEALLKQVKARRNVFTAEQQQAKATLESKIRYINTQLQVDVDAINAELKLKGAKGQSTVALEEAAAAKIAKLKADYAKSEEERIKAFYSNEIETRGRTNEAVVRINAEMYAALKKNATEQLASTSKDLETLRAKFDQHVTNIESGTKRLDDLQRRSSEFNRSLLDSDLSGVSSNATAINQIVESQARLREADTLDREVDAEKIYKIRTTELDNIKQIIQSEKDKSASAKKGSLDQITAQQNVTIAQNTYREVLRKAMIDQEHLNKIELQAAEETKVQIDERAKSLSAYHQEIARLDALMNETRIAIVDFDTSAASKKLDELVKKLDAFDARVKRLREGSETANANLNTANPTANTSRQPTILGNYPQQTSVNVARVNNGRNYLDDELRLNTGGNVVAPHMAEGGGDKIKAVLTVGEYVINADAVKHYGVDFFNRLNGMSDEPIRRNTGGPVNRDVNFGGSRPDTKYFSGAGVVQRMIRAISNSRSETSTLTSPWQNDFYNYLAAVPNKLSGKDHNSVIKVENHVGEMLNILERSTRETEFNQHMSNVESLKKTQIVLERYIDTAQDYVKPKETTKEVAVAEPIGPRIPTPTVAPTAVPAVATPVIPKPNVSPITVPKIPSVSTPIGAAQTTGKGASSAPITVINNAVKHIGGGLNGVAKSFGASLSATMNALSGSVGGVESITTANHNTFNAATPSKSGETININLKANGVSATGTFTDNSDTRQMLQELRDTGAVQ